MVQIQFETEIQILKSDNAREYFYSILGPLYDMIIRLKSDPSFTFSLRPVIITSIPLIPFD